MNSDNNAVDLDDFWAELISKSEWSKSAALKTPGEFKNLNIITTYKEAWDIINEKLFQKIDEVAFSKDLETLIWIYNLLADKGFKRRSKLFHEKEEKKLIEQVSGIKLDK